MTGVDAFTQVPFAGNPAVVCLMQEPATEVWMQNLAREMNVSETAFLYKTGDARYDLRWFTPVAEVDLCGHATLASAHSLWETGEVNGATLVFDTKSGPLAARKGDEGIALDFPRVDPTVTASSTALMGALGLGRSHNLLKAGPDLLVELHDEETVRGLAPNFTLLRSIRARGVMVTAPGESGYDFVSRFFAPAVGIDEDPVTGSAHCALGPFWAGKLGKPVMRARQLSRRGGELALKVEPKRVTLTGHAVTVWAGAARIG
ncbi:MAG: PhzF family phenazine biosynthesis isomerase [Nitrospinae bacterium]|nr:PhzF family phenazine biosynthesis isomerase [Nitrospinota bacterium]